jgi:formate dehydrogenase major subunit
MLIRSEATIFCCALGVTQQPHSVDTIKEMVNVLLLQGNFGKPGAGACPVRGHSDVQGDRTMGIWEKPKEWLLKALDGEFRIESPRHHGHDAVEAMEAFEREEVDVFVSMCGNLSLACSDTETLEAGMQRIGLTVHISTKQTGPTWCTGEPR